MAQSTDKEVEEEDRFLFLLLLQLFSLFPSPLLKFSTLFQSHPKEKCCCCWLRKNKIKDYYFIVIYEKNFNIFFRLKSPFLRWKHFSAATKLLQEKFWKYTKIQQKYTLPTRSFIRLPTRNYKKKTWERKIFLKKKYAISIQLKKSVFYL